MQLDIGVSPPANIMTFSQGKPTWPLILTHMTFDIDPWPLTFSSDFFSSDIFSSDFCSSNLHRRKATHESPSCMGIGGLKKYADGQSPQAYKKNRP